MRLQQTEQNMNRTAERHNCQHSLTSMAHEHIRRDRTASPRHLTSTSTPHSAPPNAAAHSVMCKQMLIHALATYEPRTRTPA